MILRSSKVVSRPTDMAKPTEIDAHATTNMNETSSEQMCIVQLNLALDDLSVKDYKSMFFLLMDCFDEDEFFDITKQEKEYQKEKLSEILKAINNDSFSIELFGTLKLHKKLRRLGSCQHIFEKFEQRKFTNIDGILKMFYSICEQLTGIDLDGFKRQLPVLVRDKVESLEDFFFLALRYNVISKSDFSKLETIVQFYPSCLDIINNFVKPKSYDIRTPTANIHCGIAIILNYEIFCEPFPIREGSTIDVNSLKDVWNSFGFKTEVHNDLTFKETLDTLKYYADFDHSNFDAFVCCILSHGYSNSVLSSDGKDMQIPFLISRITNICSSLELKPKLFFIQACQGSLIQQGFGKPLYVFNSPKPETSEKVYFIPPVASDVLLAVSTIDGYVSFRNVDEGSWFIQALCKIMKLKGHKLSILDVMIEVNNTVRKRSADFGPKGPRKAQQIVNCWNTFGKTLILKRRSEYETYCV